MGCFSFMCLKSGMPVVDSAPVRLFLLKDGRVLEHMHGNYDHYGTVYDGKGSSLRWKMPWSDVCQQLLFTPCPITGMAAILDEHWDGEVPVRCSEDDPDQGCGGDPDYEGMPVVKPVHIAKPMDPPDPARLVPVLQESLGKYVKLANEKEFKARDYDEMRKMYTTMCQNQNHRILELSQELRRHKHPRLQCRKMRRSKCLTVKKTLRNIRQCPKRSS